MVVSQNRGAQYRPKILYFSLCGAPPDKKVHLMLGNSGGRIHVSVPDWRLGDVTYTRVSWLRVRDQAFVRVLYEVGWSWMLLQLQFGRSLGIGLWDSWVSNPHCCTTLTLCEL